LVTRATVAHGLLASAFTVPEDVLAGSYLLTAQDDRGQAATARLTVNVGPPRITLVPATTYPGGRVEIVGRGWPEGGRVRIVAAFGQLARILARARATHGSFASALTLPSDAAPGVYRVTAHDAQGHDAEQRLTVDARYDAVKRRASRLVRPA